MMRKCDGTDQFLVKPVGDNYERCDCGQEFDDVDHNVVYPHDRIPTRTEKEDLLNVLRDIWKN